MMDPDGNSTHVVRIRNTFVNVEDADAHTEALKRRSRTVPPSACDHSRLLEEQDGSDPESQPGIDRSLSLTWNADRPRFHSLSLPSSSRAPVHNDADQGAAQPHPEEARPSHPSRRGLDRARHGGGQPPRSAQDQGPAGAERQGLASPSVAPQPQTISCKFLSERGVFQVDWTVDARKVRGNDRQVVSPAFELPFAGSSSGDEQLVIFKLMLCALSKGDCKSGVSFKKSASKGIVLLKCEGDVPESIADLSFRIFIGGPACQARPPRGPAAHNFSRCAVGGLPDDRAEWDFNIAVDEVSLTLLVRVEAIPLALGISPIWDGGHPELRE